MADESRPYRCPKCHEADGFWEPVIFQGWRSLDAHLKPVPYGGTGDRDVDWSTAERDTWASMELGCSCGWEGMRDELEVLGIDGNPLQAVHPDQMEIS
jgi:hypothetical protein